MTITNRRTKTHTESGDPAWIEWLTGAISTLLVLALIGWISMEALTEDDGPPSLSTSLNHVEKAGDLYRVDFSLVNSGATTAAAVRVVGRLTGAAEDEEAEVTFDYAPAGSRSDGSLYFRQNPQNEQVRIEPSGFTQP